MKRFLSGVMFAVAVALSVTLLAADDECGAPRCRGSAPTFLTEEIPDIQLGRDLVIPMKIKGTNEGSYFSFTGLQPKVKKVRSIHLELAMNKLTKDTMRQFQQRVNINFGMCSVSETTTTCQVTIRAKALGEVILPIKALDQCLHDDCPAPSGKEKVSYTIRTFTTSVVN